MGIFFNRPRPINELKRNINGEEEDISELDDPEDEYSIDDNDGDYKTDDEEDENPDDAPEEDGENRDEPIEDDDENQDDPDNEPAGDDYSLTDDDKTIDDEPTEDGPNDTQNTDDNETPNNDKPEEYSISGTDDEDPDDEDPKDEDTGTESDTEDDYQEDELQVLEDELFKNLNDSQKKIKVIELKTLFVKLYHDSEDLINKINKIPKSDDNIKILERIIITLGDLKDNIQFYMSNTFKTLTYIENTINFQKNLAILNAIKEIFQQIKKKKD